MHAAGILPVILRLANEPITLGDSHVFYANCRFMRSLVYIGYKGWLDFFDGLVFSSQCMGMRGAWNILKGKYAGYVEHYNSPFT